MPTQHVQWLFAGKLSWKFKIVILYRINGGFSKQPGNLPKSIFRSLATPLNYSRHIYHLQKSWNWHQPLSLSIYETCIFSPWFTNHHSLHHQPAIAHRLAVHRWLNDARIPRQGARQRQSFRKSGQRWASCSRPLWGTRVPPPSYMM